MTCPDPQLAYAIGDRLYLNIGDRCTLECRFCPKTRGSREVHDHDLTLTRLPGSEQVIAALPDLSRYREVVFCGFGEPTLRLRQLREVAAWVKARGCPTRLNTDGLGNLVHKRNILPDLQPVIDAMSISLNAHNARTYEQHCQPRLPGSYRALLEFIRLAPHYIRQVRVTAITGLPGVDIDRCRQIAESAGAGFLVRQLDVIG